MTITRIEAYDLLQVSPAATEDEIKASYRRLALRYHPDKNKDNEEAKSTFQRINAAYHLLTSEKEIKSLSEDQIVTLFQHLIRSELFSFLSQTFSFSEDDSDYYDTEEECMNCEQWQKIEKKAQENAQQLVQEEEQEKKKLEKKRERRKKHKQRRKEKKREEKDLTKEDNNKDKYEIKEVSDFPQEKNMSKPDVHVTTKKHKQQLQQLQHQQKDESSDSDQPDIDLGSAFCSKVKQKVEKERSRKASEKDATKRESPTINETDSKSSDGHVLKNGHTEPNQSIINHKTEVKQKPYVQPNPPNEEEFFKSQEHARKGNELAQFGKLHNAIEEYTKAIHLNQTDHRCYGNRSYCFHLLKRYEEALSDSDNAIRLVPNEPKGYFRKAKALCGLKRFSEAESALKKILELDAGCEEARHELFEVRMLQLQDFGFDRRACEHALMKAKGDIQAAIEFLLSSQVKDNMSFGTSDTSDTEQPIHNHRNNNTGPKIQAQQFQSFFPVVPPGSYTTSPLRMPPPIPPPGRPPLIPPFQPVQNVQFTRAPPQMTQSMQSIPPQMTIRSEPAQRKFDPRDYSLWIGHFDSKKVSEKDLYDVFAKYGKVSGVVIIKTHGKPLAYSFIHFMKHEDAKRAYNAAQNHVIQGVSLDVNWNKNPTIECEHWLRGHCPYNNCHYLHVVDHHYR